jgi:hypothetical protein
MSNDKLTVGVILKSGDKTLLDDWRRRQPDPPTRPEALRALMREALARLHALWLRSTRVSRLREPGESRPKSRPPSSMTAAERSAHGETRGQPKLVAKLQPEAVRLKPGEKPWTVQQLSKLEPGQSLRFYTGPVAHDEETPKTTWLMHLIMAAAQKLEKQGRISIEKVQIGTKEDDPTGRLSTWQFTVTALPRSAA